MEITIKENLCPGNHKCPAIRVCPVDAIIQKGVSVPKIDMQRCIKCGKCISFCPMGAIQKK